MGNEYQEARGLNINCLKAKKPINERELERCQKLLWR